MIMKNSKEIYIHVNEFDKSSTEVFVKEKIV